MAKSRTQRKVKKQMKKRTVRRGKKTMMWGGVFGDDNAGKYHGLTSQEHTALVAHHKAQEKFWADEKQAREAARLAHVKHEETMRTLKTPGKPRAPSPPKSLSEADLPLPPAPNIGENSLYDTVAPSLPSPSLLSPSLSSPSGFSRDVPHRSTMRRRPSGAK